MFRATMCPSSAADDCVILFPHVGIVPWLQEGCQDRSAGIVSIEEFVARTPQLLLDKKPTRCHLGVIFISLLQVAQNVSGNHVPIFRS